MWKMEKKQGEQAYILKIKKTGSMLPVLICLNHLKWTIIKIYMEFKKLLLPKGTVCNLDLICNFTKCATKQLLILILLIFSICKKERLTERQRAKGILINYWFVPCMSLEEYYRWEFPQDSLDENLHLSVIIIFS